KCGGTMSDAIADFGAKLTLALKHLNQSRGRLASTIGVHKSLVARWAAGAVRPSAHNVALVTQFVQRSAPRFPASSGESDLPALSARTGATLEGPAPQVASAPGRADALCGYGFAIGASSREQGAREGAAYAGLYRLYRQALNNSGAFIVQS